MIEPFGRASGGGWSEINSVSLIKESTRLSGMVIYITMRL